MKKIVGSSYWFIVCTNEIQKVKKKEWVKNTENYWQYSMCQQFKCNVERRYKPKIYKKKDNKGGC